MPTASASGRDDAHVNDPIVLLRKIEESSNTRDVVGAVDSFVADNGHTDVLTSPIARDRLTVSYCHERLSDALDLSVRDGVMDERTLLYELVTRLDNLQSKLESAYAVLADRLEKGPVGAETQNAHDLLVCMHGVVSSCSVALRTAEEIIDVSSRVASGISENMVTQAEASLDNEIGSVRGKIEALECRVSSDEVSKLADTVDDLAAKVDATRKQADAAAEKVASATTDNLAALSILVGVVLAFNATISFTASGVAAVTDLGVIEVAFVVVVAGLVLFNALFVLLTFLERVIFKRSGPWGLMTRGTFVGTNGILAAIVLGVLALLFAQAAVKDNGTATIFDVVVALLAFVGSCAIGRKGVVRLTTNEAADGLT